MAKIINNDWVEVIAGDRTPYVSLSVSGSYSQHPQDGYSYHTSAGGGGYRVEQSNRKKRSSGGDCDDLLIVGAIGLAMLGGE